MVSPTPYPEVNAVVNELLENVKEILGGQFAGMYLFGSLAIGDFDRESDVDILIATKDEISGGQFAALQAMHARLAEMDTWCAAQLEVSYIPLPALRCYDPNRNSHPRLDRGPGERLYTMRHDQDWVVQRHILREKGICVEGPVLQTLIDPVSPDDMRKAMNPVLHDWLAGLLDDPSQIEGRGYQSYIVLTICRVLYTLRSGEVASKPAAARWAKEALDVRWRPLIERAWIGRGHPQGQADREDVNGTLNLIRYALDMQAGL
jgi:predicted nucleotidyltransferase